MSFVVQGQGPWDTDDLCAEPLETTLEEHAASHLYCAWKWLCTKLGPKGRGAADGRRSSEALLASGGSCKETGKKSGDILSTLCHTAASRPRSPLNPPPMPTLSLPEWWGGMIFTYCLYHPQCSSNPAARSPTESMRKGRYVCWKQNWKMGIVRAHTHTQVRLRPGVGGRALHLCPVRDLETSDISINSLKGRCWQVPPPPEVLGRNLSLFQIQCCWNCLSCGHTTLSSGPGSSNLSLLYISAVLSSAVSKLPLPLL